MMERVYLSVCENVQLGVRDVIGVHTTITIIASNATNCRF